MRTQSWHMIGTLVTVLVMASTVQATGTDRNGRPVESGNLIPTPANAINFYTTDLVAEARNALSGLDMPDRFDIVESIAGDLERGQKSLLVYNPGDGATAVTQAVALELAERGIAVRSVNVGALGGGAVHRGELEGRLQALLNGAREAKMVLVFDNIEGLNLSSDHSAENPFRSLNDSAKDLRILVVGTEEGYRKFLHSSLRNFQVTRLTALDRQKLFAAVVEWNNRAFRERGVHFDENAVWRLLNIAETFSDPAGRLKWLKTQFDAVIAATVALRSGSAPDEERIINREIRKKEAELKSAQLNREALKLSGVTEWNQAHETVERLGRDLGQLRTNLIALKIAPRTDGGEVLRLLGEKQNALANSMDLEASLRLKEFELRVTKSFLEQIGAATDPSARASRTTLEQKAKSLQVEITSILKKWTEATALHEKKAADFEKLWRGLENASNRTAAPATTITESAVNSIVGPRIGAQLTPPTQEQIDSYFRMEDRLNERVIGQDEAKSIMARAFRRMMAGLNFGHRPQGVFLFMGPTGVGKTLLANAVADMAGRELITISMQEYQTKENASRLLGSAPGYIGYSDKTALEDIRNRPNAFVLFDEIEKAHPDIRQMLLGVTDEGRFTLSDGRTLLFSRSQIIMTSNVGAEIYSIKPGSPERMAAELAVFPTSAERSAMEELRRIDPSEFNRRLAGELLRREGFRPEWVGRVDEVVPFTQHSPNDMSKIVALEAELYRRALYQERGIILALDPQVVRIIVQRTFDESRGARSIRAGLNRYIRDAMVEPLLKQFGGNPPRDTMIAVVYSPEKRDVIGLAIPKDNAAQMIANKDVQLPGLVSLKNVIAEAPIIEASERSSTQIELPFLAEEMKRVSRSDASTVVAERALKAFARAQKAR